ncbi:MAG: hypothetical protein ACM4AI_23280 [Acidobacteriota bacterium]
MRLLAIVAVMTLPTFVCAINTAPTGHANIVVIVGDTTRVGATAVTFRRVISDSRCPLNAMCVTAGDAVAEFSVVSRGIEGLYELHLNDAMKRSVTHQGTVIEFQSLDPLPISGQPTNPSSYRAKIEVR